MNPAQPTADQFGMLPEAAMPQAPETPSAAYKLDDFLPILVALNTPRRHLTTAPTFVPRNFPESFWPYDDGVTKGLYLYFNKGWHFFTST